MTHPSEVTRRRPTRLTRLVVAVAAIAAAAPVAGAQADVDDARAIRAARERSNRAIAAHDTAALAAEWMPTIHVTSSNSARIAGRDANVRRFAEQFASRPGVVYRRTPGSVSVYGPWGMASEHGRWTGSWTDRDGPVRLAGSYFAKWRKVGGAWRIEAEIYVPERCDGGSYCRTVPPAQ